MRNGKGLIIGVDLGGTKVNAAAVDEDGTVLASERTKTLPEEGAEAVIARIAGLIAKITETLGRTESDIEGVCVGVPGGIDEATGVVDKAPNLGWQNLPLARMLSVAIGGAPVFLDNDVRVAVLGEHAYGVGRGARSMVGIFVGTGIGGGIICDGRLQLGQRGVAGEVGHVVLDPRGPLCPCGQHGCAEAFASRTSIERDVRAMIARGKQSKVLKRLKKKGRDRLTSSVVAKSLDEGDKVMTKVFDRALGYVGLLVANLVNILDPEVVVIGGGLAERLGEQMVAPIRAAAYKGFLLQRDRDHVRILPTALKDAAATVGAALVARQRLAGMHAETTGLPASP
jgi:glucokinase